MKVYTVHIKSMVYFPMHTQVHITSCTRFIIVCQRIVVKGINNYNQGFKVLIMALFDVYLILMHVNAKVDMTKFMLCWYIIMIV